MYKWFLLHWTETQSFSLSKCFCSVCIFFFLCYLCFRDCGDAPPPHWPVDTRVLDQLCPAAKAQAVLLVSRQLLPFQWTDKVRGVLLFGDSLSYRMGLETWHGDMRPQWNALTGPGFSFLSFLCAAVLPPFCNSPRASKPETLGSVFVCCCKISCLSQCWVNNSPTCTRSGPTSPKSVCFVSSSSLKTYCHPNMCTSSLFIYFLKKPSPHAIANGNFFAFSKKDTPACTPLTKTQANKHTVGSSLPVYCCSIIQLVQNGGCSFPPCEDVYVHARMCLCVRVWG